ncbi:MAG: 5-(carboxyamino)imidazole ribonucleotide synthase [Spirochaetales bacterium]|nr:5-(carboxyamino)imidazole ribonucleotide synthase [Spirochaetales bacterium]
MNVGILGGGQLARMLAQAGNSLGMESVYFCPESDCPAAPYARQNQAAYDDIDAAGKLLDWADVVTYEFENIPVPLVRFFEEKGNLYPSSGALAVSCDRLKEKTLFNTLGIETARFAQVDSSDDLAKAVGSIGLPSILKTRSGGYDGKGQSVLRAPEDVAGAFEELGQVPCILESMVPFDSELSVIAARSTTGEKVFYPVSENHHREGILRLSLSRENSPLQSAAQKMIQKILDELDYVGVLALELFQVGDKLYANEMAPRVHNSGHWTIEGACSSQFENHMRAVCGMPLGNVTVDRPTAMINIIGTLPESGLVKEVPGAVLHLYDKAPRLGRKLGHITLRQTASTAGEHNNDIIRLLRICGEEDLACMLSGKE